MPQHNWHEFIALHNMKPEETIPAQHEGISKDYRFEKTYDNIGKAQQAYQMAKNKLLDISNWNKVGGLPSTRLTITDETGTPVNTLAEQGLFVRIDLPGPGTAAGDGNDWVRIEEIQQATGDSEEQISMRLRPVSSPANKDESIAHFFDDKATSNFVLKRSNTTISIHYAGRNEVANTQAEKLVDKVRNAVVATAARLGMSDIQWSTLAKGIIETDKN